jgi:hypothetical protein
VDKHSASDPVYDSAASGDTHTQLVMLATPLHQLKSLKQGGVGGPAVSALTESAVHPVEPDRLAA